jgi:hypothetical protein
MAVTLMVTIAPVVAQMWSEPAGEVNWPGDVGTNAS